MTKWSFFDFKRECSGQIFPFFSIKIIFLQFGLLLACRLVSLHKSENLACHALLKLKIEHFYLHDYEKRTCMQKISLLAQKFKNLVFSMHKSENLPCQAHCKPFRCKNCRFSLCSNSHCTFTVLFAVAECMQWITALAD